MRVAPRAQAPQANSESVAVSRVASILLVLAVLLSLTLPGAVFAAVRNWSLTRSPGSVSGGTSVVSITATNTGDDGGGEAVGCVILTIPTAAFTVSAVTIVAVGDSGDNWSADFTAGATDTTVRLVSDSGGGNRLHQAEWVLADITFTDTGSDGTFTWTGNAFNKEDCTDDFGMPRTVSVTIDGAASNTAPVAADDAQSTAEDTLLSVGPAGVLGNDVDPDGDPILATLVGGPSHAASFTLNSDGSFDYLPEAHWSGTDTFTYQAGDGAALSGVATVTIDVAAVNDPPAGNPDSYNGTEDVGLSVDAASGVLANDSDVEGDSLTATVATTTSNGLLSLSPDGSFTYLPVLNFTGTDSFTYLVYDGSDSAGPITATIDLNGEEDDPVAVADAFSVAEEGVISPAAPGILANDSDPDGDGLTATLVMGPTSAASFTLNGDGSFTYRPIADFHGSDAFTYRASDGSRESATMTVSLDVTPVPDAPVPAADAYVVAEDTLLTIGPLGVLANDADADGDVLSAQLVTNAVHGTGVLAANGSFTYLPVPNYHGSDGFTYTVSDGSIAAGPVYVTITVLPINDPPAAASDAASLVAGESVLVAVLANDSDVEGDPLTLVSVTTPAHGSAVVEGSQARYTPDAGFSGVDTFRYRVSDGTASTLGTVTVVVKPPPATPTPDPDPVVDPTPAPTSEPVAAPTLPPSSSPAQPSTSEPSPAESATPSASSGEVPPPPASTPPPVTLPTTGPLGIAPTGSSPTGAVDIGFGTLASLLSFGWVIPGLTFFGVPGLLLVIAVLVQISGALAWLPAIRQNLGAFGFVRRRRREKR